MVTPRDGTVTFERFFRDEYPRLVPMLHAVTGDRQRAEDLAQEALAKAERDWARVGGFDKPGAWVRRVALNASSNVRRQRGREALALRRLGTAAPAAAPDAGETDEQLWCLVRRLPEQQRWAVTLFYVDDRSVGDVAAIRGRVRRRARRHPPGGGGARRARRHRPARRNRGVTNDGLCL